jgi:hypothetical protein
MYGRALLNKNKYLPPRKKTIFFGEEKQVNTTKKDSDFCGEQKQVNTTKIEDIFFCGERK